MLKIARLSGSLLARKGTAAPAAANADAPDLADPAAASAQRAGGGNPFRLKLREREDEMLGEVLRLADGGRVPVEPARAGPRRRRTDERVRLTLRLDKERRRRLRIAAAHAGCSSNALLCKALDAHLAEFAPVCACLAGTTPSE